MAEAFENVYRVAKTEKSTKTNSKANLRKLDPRQRKVLGLFQKSELITSQDVGKLFGLKPRTARLLCQNWVKSNFLIMVDPAKKSRKYKLHTQYENF